ncbi:RNA polymerase sigma-70 factor [Parabacteroides faecis]|uniref:RNA polymerase sigma-70 factor n=1 Tax=Parabacteroides TaxID=375288 RepID=UPI000EFE8FE9|nr:MULTISPECIES: RNA polymerase sigma-70 factor [Parabacteroides]MBC8616445.1 RNA polymerase sigma-70 factor [Parabacteroides faecis]RHR95221.1 RNA polymerase sigma-70 factor [Parabacteroides sp. AF14-59]
MDEKAYIKQFNYIFANHRERYIRFAYSYTYNHEVAEDLVAESLMYYWENRNRLDDVKDIPLYILIIIKNRCLDYLQRERMWSNIAETLLSNKEWELQMRISSLEACEPEALFSSEVQDLIQKTLDKLPEKSRRIFIMSRYEGKSYQTIAKETNLSVKSIEFHVSKVLTALRKELKDYLPALLFVFDFFYN